jgi:hypothetical protein
MDWLFEGVRPGDVVTRMLAGEVPMHLRVTAVDDSFIYCGGWKFRKENGAEVDEQLGWDGVSTTGSYLVPETPGD